MPTSRPARRQMTVSNEPSDVRRGLILFRRFFVGVRRLGHGPRIVLLLGFGNALERFLIGLVVDLRLFVRGVCCPRLPPPICACTGTANNASTAIAIAKVLIVLH